MALPVTITGVTQNLQDNSRPHISSGGNVYFISRGTTAGQIVCMKATDPTSSFSEVGGAGRPSNGGFTIHVVSVTQVSDVLHVMSQHQDTSGMSDVFPVEYHVFNMATDAWTTTNESVDSTPAGLSSASGDIAVRANGDRIIVYDGVAEPLMGSDWTRVDYAINTGTGWTGGNAVDNGGQANWDPMSCLHSTSGRVHFFFADTTAGTVYQRTLNSSNTLETFPSSIDSGFDEYRGTVYDDGGTSKVRVPYRKFSDGKFALVAFDSADVPSPSTTTAISDATISTASAQALAASGTDIHAVFAYQSDSDLYHDVDTGAGWGTDDQPFNITTGTITRVAANVYDRGGATKLAVVVTDAAAVKYDEYELAGDTLKQGSATATATSTSTITANARRTLGTLVAAGIAAVTVTLGAIRSADATVAGTSTASADLSLIKSLGAVESAGVATTSANLTLIKSLGTALADGVATTTATLGAIRTTSAAADGVSTATATAGALRTATAQADGVGTTSATATSGGPKQANAASDGLGTTAATLNAIRAGTATAAGAGTTSAVLVATRSATASASGTASATASLAAFKNASVQADGAATATVTGARLASASASAAGAATASATLVATRVASATATGTATAQATLNVLRLASATAAGTATTSAQLSNLGTLSATATGAGTATVTAAAILAEQVYHYRWRDDDGSEAGATWLEVEDADLSIALGAQVRVRFLVRAPAGGQYQLEVAEDGTEDWAAVEVV